MRSLVILDHSLAASISTLTVFSAVIAARAVASISFLALSAAKNHISPKGLPPGAFKRISISNWRLLAIGPALTTAHPTIMAISFLFCEEQFLEIPASL